MSTDVFEVGQVWEYRYGSYCTQGRLIDEKLTGSRWHTHVIALGKFTDEMRTCHEENLRRDAKLIRPAPKPGMRWRKPGFVDVKIVDYGDFLAVEPDNHDDLVAGDGGRGSAVEVARWLLDNGYEPVPAAPAAVEIRDGMRVQGIRRELVATFSDVGRSGARVTWGDGSGGLFTIGAIRERLASGHWTILPDESVPTRLAVKARVNQRSHALLRIGSRIRAKGHSSTGRVTRVDPHIDIAWTRDGGVEESVCAYDADEAEDCFSGGTWILLPGAPAGTAAQRSESGGAAESTPNPRDSIDFQIHAYRGRHLQAFTSALSSLVEPGEPSLSQIVAVDKAIGAFEAALPARGAYAEWQIRKAKERAEDRHAEVLGHVTGAGRKRVPAPGWSECEVAIDVYLKRRAGR